MGWAASVVAETSAPHVGLASNCTSPHTSDETSAWILPSSHLASLPRSLSRAATATPAAFLDNTKAIDMPAGALATPSSCYVPKLMRNHLAAGMDLSFPYPQASRSGRKSRSSFLFSDNVPMQSTCIGSGTSTSSTSRTAKAHRSDLHTSFRARGGDDSDDEIGIEEKALEAEAIAALSGSELREIVKRVNEASEEALAAAEVAVWTEVVAALGAAATILAAYVGWKMDDSQLPEEWQVPCAAIDLPPELRRPPPVSGAAPVGAPTGNGNGNGSGNGNGGGAEAARSA
eukprot:CAMPEP_0206457896 /NCGR_PEP_ID=MMETSP0324_2-20121206/23239_1 /ASSEMBLY_ACC=CAM_ASM_000836 /TAXON_ID=2866 /ORGANISM="Crypthecodinium cohnii, Strain Seligo" /LENGTH=287 /DNA_ID=CAMNT_0053929115 /DNA_START=76 /DNA_END=939 /DNA_ORIENTATION=+